MTTIRSLEGIAPLTLKPAGEASAQSTGADFASMLKSVVDNVNSTQENGEQAIRALQGGKAAHLHEVMIAAEEADISLRLLVQLRNKAQTAYEEIMRMQI